MAEVGLPVDERSAPPARVTQGALVTSMAQYEALYRRSVDDRDAFWSEMANEHLTWMAPFTSVCQKTPPPGEVRWFDGGKLNVAVNCLARPLAPPGDKTAIIREGDEP